MQEKLHAFTDIHVSIYRLMHTYMYKGQPMHNTNTYVHSKHHTRTHITPHIQSHTLGHIAHAVAHTVCVCCCLSLNGSQPFSLYEKPNANNSNSNSEKNFKHARNERKKVAILRLYS